MATFYLDFENGNDANNGTTFANRWKTITSGATAARTAPGDTIRIMGSPAPTSLGQTAVWTSQAAQIAQAKVVTGATNATPIAITCTAHGYSTGSTVVITGVGGNTNANGTWEITNTGANTFTLDSSAGNAAFTSGGVITLRNNTRVMLTSAVTQNIASTGPGRVAWTANTNVTTAINTGSFKEHAASDGIAIAAAFSTGKAAYWTLPSTLDLSGYQQISFWIQQTAGTVGAAGAIDLRLCSDVAGDTAVNTISVPNLAATSRWMPVTVNLGTNLGSSIQSIALYVNTDNGVQTFLLNNIIACKASSAADSLTLTSLIGKNTTGETFWGIQSINGTRVMLDADTNATPASTSVCGYYGTSETVTTWKRETIKLGPAASSSTALQTIQESGTDGSPITYSGGWDRTAMSTQNLETWLDGVNGNGLAISAMSWINTDGLSFSRFTAGFASTNAIFCNFKVKTVSNLNSTGLISWHSGARQLSIELDFGVACNGYAVQKSTNTQTNGTLIINHGVLSNSAGGVDGGQSGLFTVTGGVGQALFANNSGYALLPGAASIYTGLKTQDNGTAAVLRSQTNNIYLNKCLLSDATEVGQDSSYNYSPFYVYSQNHDQTANNHKIFMDGGLISSATDQRHTASGISWKLQPTSTTLRTSLRPVTLSLAKVACSANSLVTIKAWMYRNNAGLTMRLVCKGGQLAGVASDVTASVTTTNAWEEETITFTPTETGVVEITAEAWGGTTFSGWVDDMTILQA